MIPLYALRARHRGYEVSAMKVMMDMVGLNGGPVRPPLVKVKPEEEGELTHHSRHVGKISLIRFFIR